MISRLGSMLVREGLLTPAQHLTAVEEAEDTNAPFVSVVLRLGFVSEDRLVEVTRDRLLVPEAPHDSVTDVPQDLIERVPAQMAQQFLVCPIGAEESGSLTLLMADASDRHATDEVGYHTGRRVTRMVGAESVLRWAIQHYYGVNMDQPQPPWEQAAAEAVVLLTKVKPAVADDVMLLTPQMRRGSSDAEPVPPAPSTSTDGPKPPPTAAAPPPSAPATAAPPPSAPAAAAPPPSAPAAAAPPPSSPEPPEVDAPEKPTPAEGRGETSPGGLVAVPPLPSIPRPKGPPAPRRPQAEGEDSIPEPSAVPQLPDPPPMERTATGRKASRSQTLAYRNKGHRKRQETIQGLPKVETPNISDVAAYSVSGTVETKPSVPTKLKLPRAKLEVESRVEPHPRSHAGMWSSNSGAADASVGSTQSEAYSSSSLALKRAGNRDDVGRILFRYFQEFFLNVAFFVLRKGEIAGWDAEGIKLNKEKITKITIPTDQHSTFRDVIMARLPRRGALDETPVDLKFQTAIGYRPRDVSLVPVMIREKVIGIIYSDGVLAPIPEDEVNGLLTDAEAAYERIIRQSRGD